MFISKRHLARRTVLKGLGASIGLPLLDAMIPAATALAQTAARPTPRLGFVYFPHGAVASKWTPAGEGRDFELPQILAPLEPYKRYLTVVSGLENRNANGPVHALTPGTWLSSVTPRKSHEPFGGVTADQIAAQHIGQDLPLPSLEVATEESGGAAACDSSYGCTFSSTISFRTPSTPLPMEFNPRKLFQRLFGQGDTAEERARLAAQYSSLLDVIVGEAGELKRELGADDRTKVDAYLDSVREIERRVQKMAAKDLSHVNLPDAPMGVPNDFDEHINLMFDLVALAFQADMTRIVSFMMEAEVSDMTFNHIGVSDAFHPLSHHQGNPAKLDRLARVQAYNTSVFAKFVGKLAEMSDGDSSMLDNAILLFGSNMSNSDQHSHLDIPNAVVGGGAGALHGGTHVRYPDHTPVANLVLTVLNRAGVPIESLGDSTGEIGEV